MVYREPPSEPPEYMIWHDQGDCDHQRDNICFYCRTPWHEKHYGFPERGSRRPLRLDRKVDSDDGATEGEEGSRGPRRRRARRG